MNGNFIDEDINKFKSRMIFLMLPLLILIGFFVFLFGLTERTLQCTYDGINSYNCQTNLKIFVFDLETDTFSNITKAVMASSRNHTAKSRTTYQMQFVNENGNNFAYTNIWTNMSGSINKEVAAVNRHFEESKNFSYTFMREWFLIIFGLFFAGVPLLMLFFILHNPNDTGFKDFDAKKFLAKKDLSKMSDAEILAFIKQKDSEGK